MEWIDGIKLTDKSRLDEAHLDRKQLIDEVIYDSQLPQKLIVSVNTSSLYLPLHLVCAMLSYSPGHESNIFV